MGLTYPDMVRPVRKLKKEAQERRNASELSNENAVRSIYRLHKRTWHGSLPAYRRFPVTEATFLFESSLYVR